MSPSRSRVLPIALLVAAVAGSLACEGGGVAGPGSGSGSGGSSASGPIALTCESEASSVLVGTAPIAVRARAERAGAGARGETVTFSTTRGSISPAQATTDPDGVALAFFTPPATAGTAVVTTSVTTRNGQTFTSQCPIAVTVARDPRVFVQLLSPGSTAGLAVNVTYDPTRASLAPGAASAQGAFTAGDCVFLSNDDDLGRVSLSLACPTSRTASGAVAQLAFEHLAGGELDAGDFGVTCQAFDDLGNERTAVCTLVVTQV